MENEKRINDFFSKIKNKNLNNDDDIYTELITFERDDNLKNMKDEYVIVSREFSLEERLLLSDALSYYRLLKKNSNINLLEILTNVNYDLEKFYQVAESRINEEQNRILSSSQNDKNYEIEKLKDLSIIISMLKKYKKLRDIFLIRAYNFGNIEESSRNFSTSPAIHIDVRWDGFIAINTCGMEAKKEEMPQVKIYATIKNDKILKVMAEIGSYYIENNIDGFYKTRSYESNDMLTIRMNDLSKLDDLVKWLKSNEDLCFSNHPFMPIVDGVSISLDESGSYNRFVSETIYNYAKNSKEDLSYNGFVNYLNSKEYLESLTDHEKRMFDKNLNFALNGEMTLTQFKKEISSAKDEYKSYNALIASFKKFEKNLCESNAIYDDKALLEVITRGFDDIRNENPTYADLGNSELFYNCCSKVTNEDSLIDDLISSIPYRTLYGCDSIRVKYLFYKMIEKWNEEGGLRKIQEGIREFRKLFSLWCVDGYAANNPDKQEYVDLYNELRNIASKSSSIGFGKPFEKLLDNVTNGAAEQHGVVINKNASKSSVLRKCFKRKKELSEND